MDNPRKNTLFLAAAAFIIAALSAWYLWISQRYPFYFIWDMDLTTAIDTVLINSVLLPDHILHPGFGMYLPLSLSAKFAHLFAGLSVLNLHDLAVSLNPLAGMAELTDFIRRHSPFLALGIVFFLSAGLRSLAGKSGSRWVFLACLAVLGAHESLAYHSSMVRSELYSVFYWSLAVFFMISAAPRSGPRAQRALLVCAGLAAGLSLLSKIQSLVCLVFLLPLGLLVFSFSSEKRGAADSPMTRKSAGRLLALSFVNFGIFALLAVKAYNFPVPRGVMAPAFYGITPLFTAAFLVFLSLPIYQLLAYESKECSSRGLKAAASLTVFSSGLLAAFGLYFLVYPDAAVSLRYLLIHFKLLFFGKGMQQMTVVPYSTNLITYFKYNPGVVFINAVLTLVLISASRLRLVRLSGKQVLWCLLMSASVYANIVFMTRPNLRDLLWRETPLDLINLLYAVILVTRAAKYRRVFLITACAAVALLLGINLSHASRMPQRIDADHNLYGWRQESWLANVYGGNQLLYARIMREKYPPAANIGPPAAAAALRHAAVRRTVDFVFKNQSITHTNIGIVGEGFPVWSRDPDWKIGEIPADLRYAILVDNASLETGSGMYFREDQVQTNASDYIDKTRKAPPGKEIVVLSRSDLRIFLFVLPEEIPVFASERIIPTPYRITVSKGGNEMTLYGLRIANYAEIPGGRARERNFFVIAESFR